MKELYNNTVVNPEWYWIKGLHDAKILKITDCPIEQIRQLNDNQQINNCLEFLLDSSQAMYDTTITGIQFFNYKEFSDRNIIEGLWWKSDSLTKDGRKYTLEIKCGGKKTDKYTIRFESCRVVR